MIKPCSPESAAHGGRGDQAVLAPAVPSLRDFWQIFLNSTQQAKFI